MSSLREIARRAQISVAAVSLALRGSRKVSAATRERVAKIAAKAGYRPDWQAAMVMRRFRSARRAGSAGTLAVVYPTGKPRAPESWPNVLDLVPVVQERAAELNFSVDVISLHRARRDGPKLHGVLTARGTDGIIVLGAFPQQIDRLPFDRTGFHTVAIGFSVKEPLHRICPDQYGDTFRALEQLRGLGYRRPGLLIYHDLDQRTQYRFTAAHLAHARSVGEAAAPPIYVGSAENAPLRAWLKSARPDALILEEPAFAPEWIIDQARAVGLRVPRDVALCSTDVMDRPNGDLLAGTRQGWRAVGRRAVEVLAGRIYQGPAGGDESLPSIELVAGAWSPGWSAPGRRRRQ